MTSKFPIHLSGGRFASLIQHLGQQLIVFWDAMRDVIGISPQVEVICGWPSGCYDAIYEGAVTIPIKRWNQILLDFWG